MAERGSKALHALDRYLGIPILKILGFFINKRKKIPTNIHRIAIFRTAAIGDTVLLSAIIKDIKIKYPDCEVVLFAGSSNFGISPLIPNLDKYILLPVRNLIGSYKIIREAGNFDICIDTGQWPRLDAIMAFFAIAKFRIGFETKFQNKHSIFHKKIEHLDSVHEIENFRNLIKPLNVATKSLPQLKFTVSQKLKDIQAEQDTPYIVIHPWAGGVKSYLKEWSDDNWYTLITSIISQNFRVFITGSTQDFDKTEAIVSKFNSSLVKNMAGILKLEETVGLVNDSKALICVNTGIMHIGSALDIPVIALHGPTNSMRWGPLNKKSIIINSPGKGCGFLNLGFEYDNNPEDCMDQIKIDVVLEAFRQIINKTQIISD